MQLDGDRGRLRNGELHEEEEDDDEKCAEEQEDDDEEVEGARE